MRFVAIEMALRGIPAFLSQLEPMHNVGLLFKHLEVVALCGLRNIMISLMILSSSFSNFIHELNLDSFELCALIDIHDSSSIDGSHGLVILRLHTTHPSRLQTALLSSRAQPYQSFGLPVHNVLDQRDIC